MESGRGRVMCGALNLFVEGGLRHMSVAEGVRRVKVFGRGEGSGGCVGEGLWMV